MTRKGLYIPVRRPLFSFSSFLSLALDSRNQNYQIVQASLSSPASLVHLLIEFVTVRRLLLRDTVGLVVGRRDPARSVKWFKAMGRSI